MDEAGDCLLQALQAHNKGLSLHRQVEYHLPKDVRICINQGFGSFFI
jgi:hypothetical protein